MSKAAVAATNAQGADELDEIPFYLREVIQKIIDARSKKRVAEEMNTLKKFVRKELSDMKVQNQVQITNHTNNGGRPGTAWHGRDFGFNHAGYGHGPGFGAGHPGYGGHPGFGGYGHGGYGHGGFPHHFGPGYAHHPAAMNGELIDPAFYGAYRHVSPVRHIQAKKDGVSAEAFDTRYSRYSGSNNNRASLKDQPANFKRLTRPAAAVPAKSYMVQEDNRQGNSFGLPNRNAPVKHLDLNDELENNYQENESDLQKRLTQVKTHLESIRETRGRRANPVRPGDASILKAFKAPPELVQRVSCMAYLLFGNLYKKAKDWNNSRKVFERNQYEELLALDWDTAFTPKRWEVMSEAFNKEDFNAKSVRSVSQALESYFLFVNEVYTYWTDTYDA